MRDTDSNVRKRKLATAATEGRPRPSDAAPRPGAVRARRFRQAARPAPRGHGRPLFRAAVAR